MSIELIKFAFVAGELSPTFLGRSDLEKFDLGLAEAVNWFVDYRGGMTTRAGSIFGDFIEHDDLEVKLFQFKYAPNLANTYVMLFGHNYIRFIQENAYVLEAAKTITGITKANPGVVTSNAHGFANGDWLKMSVAGMSELHGRTVVVAGVTANTFQLKDVFGNNINTTAYTTFTSGTASRIYTLVSPYASTDLAGLTVFQQRDLVRLTSLDFAPRELVRVDHTNWSISLSTFGSVVARPTGLTLTPNGVQTSGAAYAVTALDVTGEESLQSDVSIIQNGPDFTGQENVKLKWTVVPDAVSYNIYRSLYLLGGSTDITRAGQLGYLGQTFGTVFIDTGITADFTKSPPLHNAPFAPGVITNITLTGVGAGYTQASVMTVTDAGGGSGFIGFPIVESGGTIVGIVIINGGSGYVTPVASFSVGAGATVTFDISPMTGMYPALSTVFQQRQAYAASDNSPLTIWASKPKRFDNFDVSDIVADNDSYEFELDSDEVTPIKHLVPVKGGLLTMTEGGIWLLTGGGLGDPVTPVNALAEPNSYTGISSVPPIRADSDLIYIEGKGFTARILEYSDFSRVYSGKDISIISNHLFTTKNYITRWTFAADPFKIVWARRLDGSMLMFTMVKEQNVFAWTRAYTQGLYEDVLSVQEGRTDSVYTVVKRYVNGRWTKYFEAFATRIITDVESAHCVDSGLMLTANEPAADITISAATGTVVVTADAAVFAAGDVGKIFRGGGAKGVVTIFTDATHITVDLVNDVTYLVPEDDTDMPLPIVEGDWTLDAKVSTVGGLWHLIGKEVSILLDGNVMPKATVAADGTLALGGSGSRVIVGLPFSCVAKTLPMIVPGAVVENRRKRVTGLGVRLHESRGLLHGTRRDKLYSMKERTVESYGEPTLLQTGMKNVLMMAEWKEDGNIYFVQEDPLPSSILGYVASTEIGDDPD